MQNLLGTTQSRLAQSLSTQSEQSLSLTHGFFHKVINNCGGGGANTLHSLNKSHKNTLHSYKTAKSAKKLFHAIIARAFNESPNQSKLSVIARFGNAQSWQSKQNLKSRILDCFVFLQKSRHKTPTNDKIANLRLDSRICK